MPVQLGKKHSGNLHQSAILNFIKMYHTESTSVELPNLLKIIILNHSQDIASGRFSVISVLTFDIDLSKVNCDIWHRCCMSNFMKFGLLLFEKSPHPPC